MSDSGAPEAADSGDPSDWTDACADEDESDGFSSLLAVALACSLGCCCCCWSEDDGLFSVANQRQTEDDEVLSEVC